MSLKGETSFENDYIGEYQIVGSCGSLKLAPEDKRKVDEWVQANSIGELRDGRYLLFDGQILSTVKIERNTEKEYHHYQHGSKVKYKVNVDVRNSPNKIAGLPDGLAQILDEEGFY